MFVVADQRVGLMVMVFGIPAQIWDKIIFTKPVF